MNSVFRLVSPSHVILLYKYCKILGVGIESPKQFWSQALWIGTLQVVHVIERKQIVTGLLN